MTIALRNRYSVEAAQDEAEKVRHQLGDKPTATQREYLAAVQEVELARRPVIGEPILANGDLRELKNKADAAYRDLVVIKDQLQGIGQTAESKLAAKAEMAKTLGLDKASADVDDARINLQAAYRQAAGRH